MKVGVDIALAISRRFRGTGRGPRRVRKVRAPISECGVTDEITVMVSHGEYPEDLRL